MTMSILAKIVVVLGASPLVSASVDECNGLNIMGLMTWSEGVCRNERSHDMTTSNMIVCNENQTDVGELWFWDHANCTGAVMHVMSLTELVDAFMIPGGVVMVCDGVDCPYAMVRSYELNGTAMDMYDGMSTTEDMMISTEDMWGSTEDMSTEDMWGSTEDWESWNSICEDWEFEAWQEHAIAVSACFQSNDTAIFMEHVCQDGNFTVEYYNNSDCSGTALHTEPHFAHEGICPQVVCSSETTDEPTAIEESTEDDVRPTDHLVAIGFALITVVVGSV